MPPDALIKTKLGSNQHRWLTAAKDKAFIPQLARVIVETPDELLLTVMQAGKVAVGLIEICCRCAFINVHQVSLTGTP